MKSVNKSWACFVVWVIGVLVLFLCWPGIATIWASSIKESADTGATKDQFEIFSDVHASLGVLFTGFAFIGTYFLLRESRKQTVNAEKQLACQRKQTKVELSRNQFRHYKDNIAAVHQFYARISSEYDKKKVSKHFGAMIQGLYQGNEVDEEELFFLNMKTEWHATCCLYSITMNMIAKDLTLGEKKKTTLFRLLHAPFSPLDEVAMAIFYHGTIDFDIFNHVQTHKTQVPYTYVWCQFNSFEEYAKNRIKSISQSLFHLEVQEGEINRIFDDLSKILRTQNCYPTHDGNLAPW